MSHSTIRTFRAASVREALAQVRSAFGPDAVVLQAREVPATLFRKAEFEVMAALEDEQLAAAGATSSAPATAASQASTSSSASASTQNIDRKPARASSVDHLAPPAPYQAPVPSHQASALQSRESRHAAPLADARDFDRPAPARNPSPANPSRKPSLPQMSRPAAAYANAGGSNSSQSAITPEAAAWFAQPASISAADSEPAFINEPGFSPPARPSSSRASSGGGFSEWQDEVRDLRAALDEARSMLTSFSAQGRAGSDSMLAPAASEANSQLLAHGVDAALAAQLVRTALAQGIPHETTAIIEAIRSHLSARLTADRAPWLRGGRHTLAFVGPTGVGKTTTLAKIAARALMEGNRRVGLITVDTYRIGASEQLARYGEIMGVPAFVAKNARELVAAVERCSRCDLILIDTAGRSGPDQLQRQIELVRAAPEVELHLVASAASGARDLAAIADRYSVVRPDRLLITKVDEAASPGGLLSATAGLGVPVSCISNGQRVPEDIHAVTRKDLVDLVLGSWNNERN